METSDSEYFESADEDFESDYEEPEKRHLHGRQNASHKIIGPEFCKLKITEAQENKNDTTQKNIDNTINNALQGAEPLNKELIEKYDANESEVKSLLDSVNNSKDSLDSKRRLGSKKIIIDEKNCEETNSQNLDSSDNLKETFAPSLTENTDLKLTDTDIKTTELNKKVVIEPEKDENLWDDEIDWGSEAAKEESQKTGLNPPNSKNEDSGWDDFDVEWDSESHTSKEFNTNEHKIAKAANNTIKIPASQPSKENPWEDNDDGWEPLEKPKESESSWGGWGTWDVTSILNTATQSVSSLTTHVSHGFSTVLESGIGIPEPEEMARINRSSLDKEETIKELHIATSDNSPVGFGLGNLVSGVSQLTKFVESTGTKVIAGGLDTLEAIGKKTAEVLQDGDPGLKRKRAFLKLDTGKPNLSQILREAKERADKENKELAQKHNEVKRVRNYEALFDDHQGLVHLEALEMLSRLCNIKLQNLNNSLSGEALRDMQETLEQVKELCEVPEDEEDDNISTEQAKETICDAVKEINIPISYDKFFAVCNETDTWLENVNLTFIDDVELHQQAIDTLAQLTALAVEQFHKTGELLLVKEHRSTADEADSLVQITATVKSLILHEAGKFTDKLNIIGNSDKDRISEHITNIFYEAANSGSYIQDAFQLLIPVLQVGAV